MIIQKEIELRARELKLYSVMKSEKGVCCMINNKILYEGDLVEEMTVKHIGDNNVTLELEGMEVLLKMSN